ncbi:MAG: superoxide dismutase [Candidatus Thermoplasmatota archaeon]|nr:superoxide dismutase [Candidatus Thermoplasmatota archaeon]
MPHKLPDLPYEYDSLKGISEDVVRLHHDKHHAGYVKGRNSAEQALAEAREKGDFSNIRKIKEDESFNQSGQVLHNIYWENMGGPGGRPSGDLLAKIEEDFGSFDTFEEEFRALAGSSGRSGWALLVFDMVDGKLHTALVDFHNLFSWWNVVPILALDFWEHAYYYDQTNERGKYVDAFFDNLNWEDVAERLDAAQQAFEVLAPKFQGPQ